MSMVKVRGVGRSKVEDRMKLLIRDQDSNQDINRVTNYVNPLSLLKITRKKKYLFRE